MRGPLLNGEVTVLQGGSPTWEEKPVYLLSATMDNTANTSIFDNIWLDLTKKPPTRIPATENILGFTQLADDNLGVIKFTHTFQIPGLR